MLQEEPEEEPEEPTDDVAERMRQYASLHPVYNRCAKQADLTAFNAEITKTCGNVNELSTCSYSCTSAMRKWSSKMGCCFETVLDAYKHADPSVEHQWRMWQGTMSGKCGVTFEADNCGEAVGEHGFRELENQVDDLKKTAAQNQDNIQVCVCGRECPASSCVPVCQVTAQARASEKPAIPAQATALTRFAATGRAQAV